MTGLVPSRARPFITTSLLTPEDLREPRLVRKRLEKQDYLVHMHLYT